jgi:hypothetical protein
MRNGEKLLLPYPVFVVKETATHAMGIVQGDVVGLAMFSDFDTACEFVEPGMWLQRFDTATELLVYLRGLTGDYNHVVLDHPIDGKISRFVKLDVFIEKVAAAELA